MTDFLFPTRVYYEDTDSGGVVYYANYLKFMERARTEFLRALGFEQDVLARDDGVIFAVRSVSVDYLQPARFNDLLQVTANITNIGGASLVFEQTIFRDREAHSKPLCTATVKVVCLDARTLRPKPIPERIIAELPSREH